MCVAVGPNTVHAENVSRAAGIWFYNRPVCLCWDLNCWPLGLQITKQRFYPWRKLPPLTLCLMLKKGMVPDAREGNPYIWRSKFLLQVKVSGVNLKVNTEIGLFPAIVKSIEVIVSSLNCHIPISVAAKWSKNRWLFKIWFQSKNRADLLHLREIRKFWGR